MVTGCKGLLGSEFCRMLEGQDFRGIDLPEVDITDRVKLRQEVLGYAPNLVIHCAAYTKVDQAESEPELAFKTNALATRWLAEVCSEIGAVMVYFSTDYVFCDTPGASPRTEFDFPAPRGVYARSKFAGETEVRAFLPAKHYIIRTSWLYGKGGKNFVEAIIRLARDKPFLTVINDQIGSPTYAPDLASEILRLVENGAFGTYHITGNGTCSWYQFAREILKLAGIDTKVFPISTVEFGALSPRPAYSVLDHFALRETVGDNMPHWKDSLKRHLKET